MDAPKPRPSSSKSGNPALRSEFADDPDMREIIEFFLSDLGERVGAIRAAFDGADRARLKTLAHQLKGAAGGYGFPSIGNAAAMLEHELVHDQAGISTLHDRVEDLIRLCQSAMPAN